MSPEDLARLLSSKKGRRELAQYLLKIVHRALAGLVEAYSRATGTNAREGLVDLEQEVLLMLFANDARALRSWDPERGKTFESYVWMLAQRHFFKTAKRKGKPWSVAMDPVDEENFPPRGQAADPELLLIDAEALERIREKIHEGCNEKDWEVYCLRKDGQSYKEIAAEKGMSIKELHAWHSRIMRLLKKIFGDFDE